MYLRGCEFRYEEQPRAPSGGQETEQGANGPGSVFGRGACRAGRDLLREKDDPLRISPQLRGEGTGRGCRADVRRDEERRRGAYGIRGEEHRRQREPDCESAERGG